MYARFFGLRQQPFSIAPDPRYLFMSERHREALAHLVYGLKGGGGFVLLTGEIGAGKTTVCRCFLEQLPEGCNVAYIVNPKQTATELLRSICHEFHIALPGDGPPTAAACVDALNEFLLRAHGEGQTSVLIIDEAQNLSADVLEQLRLLTNLETSERKLLQIILIGQPELRNLLARPELEQLAQRVIARFHLGALSEGETAQYIRHRMSVAGVAGTLPFDARALKQIHLLTRGVPRRINLLCDRALLGAYASNRSQVDLAIVRKAAEEVFDRSPARRKERQRRERRMAVGVGLAAAVLVLAGALVQREFGNARPVAVATASPRPAASAATPRPAAPAASVVSAGASAPAATAAASAASGAAVADAASAFGAAWRSEAEAWRRLAPAWQVAQDDGEDACDAATRQQVQCFRSKGTLALIRLLDRPVLLTLQLPGGRPGYALLTGLSPREATLAVDSGELHLPLTALGELWRGEFATFWRPPPGGSPPPPEWLATQLAVASGQPAASAAAASDATVRSRLSAFQVAQGLTADGLAGPLTLMQINRATGINEPRLKAEH